jgi:hypothetical protein
MNNVIELFSRKNKKSVAGPPSETDTSISTNLTSIMALTGQLGGAVKDVLKHFDAIENAIDTIDDTETRNRLKRTTELSREAMLKAVLQLALQIGKLVRCRRA